MDISHDKEELIKEGAKENVVEFGIYLKKLRKGQKLSRRELAELSGVSQSYIAHIEAGIKPNVPSRDILLKLIPFLGVSGKTLLVKAGWLGKDDNYINNLDSDIAIKLIQISFNHEIRNEYQDELISIFKKHGVDSNITNRKLTKNKIMDNIIYQIDDIEKMEAIHADICSIKTLIHEMDSNDLFKKLQDENIHYRTHKITDTKKELIIAYLDALFKE